MSYRIVYSEAVGKYEVRQFSPFRIPLILAVVAICLAVFWPQSWEALRGFLIPGEDAVTAAAFHAMTDDLRSGAGIWQAFADFCRVVVHGL